VLAQPSINIKTTIAEPVHRT